MITKVWWTLTGNFGNMMPIDWSKSYTRAAHLPTLNLCDPRCIAQPVQVLYLYLYLYLYLHLKTYRQPFKIYLKKCLMTDVNCIITKQTKAQVQLIAEICRVNWGRRMI